MIGPLEGPEENPRYFTVASGDGADRQAVYLTGSHIERSRTAHTCAASPWTSSRSAVDVIRSPGASTRRPARSGMP